MNPEIPKMELKLAEMRAELAQIRPLMCGNTTLMGRSVTLCEMIAQCEKKIANARVFNHLVEPTNSQQL